MAKFENLPRVGRTQGAVIFWGLVSAFFATAFCFYFSKSYENEKSANTLRDQIVHLQEQCDELTAEKNRLQDSIAQAQIELKTREDILQDKETTLADEENHLETQARQVQEAVAPDPAQAAMLKKFSDALRKIAQNNDGDVSDHDGRPLLRVPNSVLFASADAALKPDGKTLLNQVAQALGSLTDHFELRISAFTDTDTESTDSKTDSAAKPHFATSWDLTAARAAAMARYLRDQTSLSFQNVLVAGRGDSEPVSTIKDMRAHNRRVEITIDPLPVPFRSTVTSTPTAASANSLQPPPDVPAAHHP
ncbi:MAG: OmpA family protein [Methylacidiphilales bacterium]|nr:OmpA family protein [Candidatus Methylacidiphilales bacterium]